MMVTKASVSKWDSGQSYPDILLLPKLVTFFNITEDELMRLLGILNRKLCK